MEIYIVSIKMIIKLQREVNSNSGEEAIETLKKKMLIELDKSGKGGDHITFGLCKAQPKKQRR